MATEMVTAVVLLGAVKMAWVGFGCCGQAAGYMHFLRRMAQTRQRPQIAAAAMPPLL